MPSSASAPTPTPAQAAPTIRYATEEGPPLYPPSPPLTPTYPYPSSRFPFPLPNPPPQPTLTPPLRCPHHPCFNPRTSRLRKRLRLRPRNRVLPPANPNIPLEPYSRLRENPADISSLLLFHLHHPTLFLQPYHPIYHIRSPHHLNLSSPQQPHLNIPRLGHGLASLCRPRPLLHKLQHLARCPGNLPRRLVYPARIPRKGLRQSAPTTFSAGDGGCWGKEAGVERVEVE